MYNKFTGGQKLVGPFGHPLLHKLNMVASDYIAKKTFNFLKISRRDNLIQLIQSWRKKTSLFYAKLNTVQIDQNE